MNKILPLVLALALSPFTASGTAHACGGFFCGVSPVDQAAERIVFSVNDDETITMAVQVSYQGKSEDFAWVLPLPEVPDAESLKVIPTATLVGLDAQTGPQFRYPDDCPGINFAASAESDDGGGSGGDPVLVHIQKKVGGYIASVIESKDPEALLKWLRENGYRVPGTMDPYIVQYTEEGMKFLALKLSDEADVTDIQPFVFTLPGTTPSIPLRMTALAAEPEMGIVVLIAANQRFAPANWPEVTIDDGDLVWNPGTWPVETNWTSLVAKGVDKAGGQGWVTELVEETTRLRDLAENSFPQDEDQEKAVEAILDLLKDKTHITRLYTRLSAEEMSSDPVFRRDMGGPVSRERQLPELVNGKDACEIDPWSEPEAAAALTTPCDFVTCGAGGLCRTAMVDGSAMPGCACVPGATARTTLDPEGQATVVCQDQRMSFLNPGDKDDAGQALPDPCVGFECGAGTCLPINMTPTCVCDEGFVATGTFKEDGTRTTVCRKPTSAVPESFYQNRLPELGGEMMPGREVDVPEPKPLGAGGGACSIKSNAENGATPWLLALGLGLALLRRRRTNHR